MLWLLEPLAIAIKAKAFAFGESLFFACAKKSNQKKRFTAAERLIKHTPPSRPQLRCGSAERVGFFDGARPLRGRVRGIAARRMPARRGEAVLRLFPASPAPAKNDVLVRYAAESGAFAAR
ncbi:hypothetical protein, partial [[Pseudomonas] boreopolis]|uniref:hypothetical protein n=1 Tax=Xanthomonas boreopolis TaxID=86183 RepID=UPI003D9BEAC9